MSKTAEEDNWNYFEVPSQSHHPLHTIDHRAAIEGNDDDSLPPPYDAEAFNQVNANLIEKPAATTITPQPLRTNCINQPNPNDGTVKLDQPIEIRGENKFDRAIRLYGNPLAQDAKWSVSDDDYNLKKLPKIDFSVKMTNSLKPLLGPAKRDRPGFLRDPKQNLRFNPNASFESFLIPNKLKCSQFVGTGFSSVFKGNVMASHDVSAADWRQFLDDIAAAGSSAVGSIPLGLNLSKTGIPLTRAVGKFLQWTREESAQEVLRTWQRKFFRPRGLDVAVDDRGLDEKLVEHMENMNASLRSSSYATNCERNRAHKELERQLKTFFKEEKCRSKTYGRVRLIISSLNDSVETCS